MLEISGSSKKELISALSEPQARAVAAFVRFMIRTHAAAGDEIYGESWKRAYGLYWKKF